MNSKQGEPSPANNDLQNAKHVIRTCCGDALEINGERKGIEKFTGIPETRAYLDRYRKPDIST